MKDRGVWTVRVFAGGLETYEYNGDEGEEENVVVEASSGGSLF